MPPNPHPPSAVAPVAASPTQPSARKAWKLTRNCAMRPRTFLWNIGALAVSMGAIGTGFWIAGYPLVMFFCGFELAALGIAGFVYARHATDGERVRVEAGTVRIETSRGCQRRVVEFHACWVRLHRDGSGALTLRSGSAAVPVGEQLTPARRKVFAEEFAASIARARQWDASLPAANQSEPR